MRDQMRKDEAESCCVTVNVCHSLSVASDQSRRCFSDMSAPIRRRCENASGQCDVIDPA